MSDLTKEQITLIQESYQSIQAQQGYLAEAFYRTLFRIAPSARALFPEDISGQMDKFGDMLDFIVNNLGTPWIFTGKVKRLGRRHTGYGATPEHYDVVGEALLQAIEEMAPNSLSEAEVEAWTSGYQGIANMMKEAAAAQAA